MTAAERFIQGQQAKLASKRAEVRAEARERHNKAARVKRQAASRRRRALVTVYDVEETQRLDCAIRLRCLNIAARAEVRALSCVGCGSYQREPREMPPLRREWS